MFVRRLVTVGGAILGGFAAAAWLIFAALDPDPGPRRPRPDASGPHAAVGAANPSLAARADGRGPQPPFPPLVDLPAVPAAGAAEVRDDDQVVGVEVGGEARAYPINMLSRPDRHVLNDTLGGRPIAVTWCGLCQSPLVFARQAAGRTLVFFVPGGVFGENMALQDVETGSRWAQILGEARDGPLKGTALEQIPSVWTDWKTWRAGHPATTVLNVSRTVDYYRFRPDHPGAALEQKYLATLQWGLARGGKALSWPFKELMRQPVVNDALGDLPLLIFYDAEGSTLSAFERRLGDRVPTFRGGRDGLIDDATGSTWDPVTGRALRGPLAGSRLTPVPGIISHLRAWRTFHPESESRTAHPDGKSPG